MGKEKDVSKQTVVVLVFLVILVSVLGTFTVLQEANKVAPYAEMPHSETTATSSRGVVKLHIGERIPIEDSVNGEVRLNIVN